MSDLPSELEVAPPRPLPPFAPSLTWPVVIEALCAAGSVVLATRGEEWLVEWFAERAHWVAIAVAVLLQLIGLGVIVWALRTRSLLRSGTPAVGEVLFSRRKDAAQLHVRYRFTTPRGKRLERDYFMGEGSISRLGFAPAAGDIAYVVHARDPRRFYLWGFAKGQRPHLVSYPDALGAAARERAARAGSHPG